MSDHDPSARTKRGRGRPGKASRTVFRTRIPSDVGVKVVADAERLDIPPSEHIANIVVQAHETTSLPHGQSRGGDATIKSLDLMVFWTRIPDATAELIIRESAARKLHRGEYIAILVARAYGAQAALPNRQSPVPVQISIEDLGEAQAG